MTGNAPGPVGVSAADIAIGVPRVGVAVVVLHRKDNRVLVGKRKAPHGQGKAPLHHNLTTI
jgi:hypothetical protein